MRRRDQIRTDDDHIRGPVRIARWDRATRRGAR
jgi:hypothetical protein